MSDPIFLTPETKASLELLIEQARELIEADPMFVVQAKAAAFDAKMEHPACAGVFLNIELVTDGFVAPSSQAPAPAKPKAATGPSGPAIRKMADDCGFDLGGRKLHSKDAKAEALAEIEAWKLEKAREAAEDQKADDALADLEKDAEPEVEEPEVEAATSPEAEADNIANLVLGDDDDDDDEEDPMTQFGTG